MYKTKRRYKDEPVRPDPTVDPTENETAIYFMSADRHAWISSYEPVIVERLLHHPNFKIEQLITMQIEKQECVVGVIGKLPVGAVRIRPATSADSHELVVQVPGYRPAKPAQVITQTSAGQAKRELLLNLSPKSLKAKSQARARQAAPSLAQKRPQATPVSLKPAKQNKKQVSPQAKVRKPVTKKPSRAKPVARMSSKTKARPLKRKSLSKPSRKRRR